MNLKQTAIKSIKPFQRALPIILGAILLVSLVSTLPKYIFTTIFTKNIIIDPLISAGIGSILAGNPVTSYILAGEFLNLGISQVAVIAFLVAWVTVGIVQLPVEITTLGKKFAITRNLLSYIFSIFVAVTTVLILNIL